MPAGGRTAPGQIIAEIAQEGLVAVCNFLQPSEYPAHGSMMSAACVTTGICDLHGFARAPCDRAITVTQVVTPICCP